MSRRKRRESYLDASFDISILHPKRTKLDLALDEDDEDGSSPLLVALRQTAANIVADIDDRKEARRLHKELERIIVLVARALDEQLPGIAAEGQDARPLPPSSARQVKLLKRQLEDERAELEQDKKDQKIFQERKAAQLRRETAEIKAKVDPELVKLTEKQLERNIHRTHAQQLAYQPQHDEFLVNSVARFVAALEA
ncbi:uncharacterized protein L969DRAFT_339326 [Mixia osmundae IAM 14324]|uniref:Uncharacterized protein n=1 Tax=Mixia osmundae (strain CBS 9802 / IAM 14324 / JCM 22182 / KY 12970) TaxID=764103 RepID=G7E627_MIXOS|nr:uncharacterized protein L969DRAFT_339326 [Mixia osmundae IAM 14324]KEI40563.1 hypothetical protein L969DRAFT_339326 [Mixia osmundae IAM 14324]GAA98287.1 hypothetical protein E5Q_04970 [Mixia osmundae IAM 14324]